MRRKQFIKLLATIPMITGLSSFNRFADDLPEQDTLMPLLFIGHGSPMNAIENNMFTAQWREIAKNIPTPVAVLIVSAHWLTRGTKITAMPNPKTIHDFGGFPDELHRVQYPAPGNPELAKETAALFQSTAVGLDHDWGLDHGAWSVVKQMYPNADVPMLQLSIDYYKGAEYLYDLAKELAALRKKGVLILASGNMVHNLGMIKIPANGDFNAEFGYDWALEINTVLKNKITEGNHQALVRYEALHKDIKLAIPTPDHYFPMLFPLALQGKNEEVTFFNDKAIAGSLTMTSFVIQA